MSVLYGTTSVDVSFTPLHTGEAHSTASRLLGANEHHQWPALSRPAAPMRGQLRSGIFVFDCGFLCVCYQLHVTYVCIKFLDKSNKMHYIHEMYKKQRSGVVVLMV